MNDWGCVLVMLLLALARKLPEGLSNVQNRVLGGPTGTSLYGKTIGIVGSGSVDRCERC